MVNFPYTGSNAGCLTPPLNLPLRTVREMVLRILLGFIVMMELPVLAAGPEDTAAVVPTCPLVVVDDCAPMDPLRLYDSIPSAALYKCWTPYDINPYMVSRAEVPECIPLVLVDSLECDFVVPFNGRVTSPFGPRRHRIHKGTDIDLETGDSVMCAFDGVVRVAQYSGGYGNVVVVRHFNGLETIYAHLSKLNVAPGQRVSAGELIGMGGQTGRATGSHLHFEIRYLGFALDSAFLIDWDSGVLRQNEVEIPLELLVGG